MPTLLTVSGARVDLEANHSYTLGRAPTCDILVDDIAASREHARVTVGGVQRALFVDDLNSRNGTYVDGARIEERTPLLEGSRIRIGATVYLLTFAEAGAETDEDGEVDTGTVAIESLSLGTDVDEKLLRVARRNGRTGAGFAGQLSCVNFIDTLQILLQTGASGTLRFELESGPAKIEIRHGEIYTAVHQELTGFHALLHIAGQRTGLFWLVETAEPCRRLIRESNSELLLNLCRALDEAAVR